MKRAAHKSARRVRQPPGNKQGWPQSLQQQAEGLAAAPGLGALCRGPVAELRSRKPCSLARKKKVVCGCQGGRKQGTERACSGARVPAVRRSAL